MTPPELNALVERLSVSEDHIVASGEVLEWLAMQIVRWPTRVDLNRTTNDRFLRESAAVTMLAQAARIEALEKALDMLPDEIDIFRWIKASRLRSRADIAKLIAWNLEPLAALSKEAL